MKARGSGKARFRARVKRGMSVGKQGAGTVYARFVEQLRKAFPRPRFDKARGVRYGISRIACEIFKRRRFQICVQIFVQQRKRKVCAQHIYEYQFEESFFRLRFIKIVRTAFAKQPYDRRRGKARKYLYVFHCLRTDAAEKRRRDHRFQYNVACGTLFYFVWSARGDKTGFAFV